ncbi:hypothetical protein, partial [Escherichia coli]|uniref:hypothetical protein n=1 Tax=Escherichia coli TaxID=562 RepID=UPI00096A1B3E
SILAQHKICIFPKVMTFFLLLYLKIKSLTDSDRRHAIYASFLNKKRHPAQKRHTSMMWRNKKLERDIIW